MHHIPIMFLIRPIIAPQQMINFPHPPVFGASVLLRGYHFIISKPRIDIRFQWWLIVYIGPLDQCHYDEH